MASCCDSASWTNCLCLPILSANFIATRADSTRGRDIYRINDLAKTVKEGQQGTVSIYAPPPPCGVSDRGGTDGRMRAGGAKFIPGVRNAGCGSGPGAMPQAGWSDAACGDRSAEGKCGLGYVIGLTPSTLYGPCHIAQLPSQFTRGLVKSGHSGEV